MLAVDPSVDNFSGPRERPAPGRVLIYALFDPRTCIPRYVGQTTRPLARWRQHQRLSNLTASTHKNHWLSELIADGHEPFFVGLDECAADQADEAEIRWIARMRDFVRACGGPPLTNGTDGGGGVRGRVLPDAERRALAERRRGVPLAEETKRRIGEASRRSAQDPGLRRRRSELAKGQVHSIERRRKNSETHRRPEIMAVHLAANRGAANHAAKLSAADVHALRLLSARGTTGKALAARFGISETQVSRILNGGSWGWLR